MFEIALVTVFALLPISNPFSTIPLYLSLTAGHSRKWGRQQALKAAIYMAGILLVFLWGGALIKEFFGISIPAIRVAGGVIIMRVGFNMLNPKDSDDISKEAKQEPGTKKDFAFAPLAMLSLSGPVSFSVVFSVAAASDNILGYLAFSMGILFVVLVAGLPMRSAPLI